MPNELKLPLNGSTHLSSNGSSSKKSSRIGSSTVTAMVWTISGIVLAACTNNKFVDRNVTSTDGGSSSADGGSSSLVPGGGISGDTTVRVVDGPVKGAAVYFDLNNDGTVSQEERMQQTDENGRPFYITDENGEAEVPDRFATTLFLAVVEGATDTATGEVLLGKYYSLFVALVNL